MDTPPRSGQNDESLPPKERVTSWPRHMVDTHGGCIRPGDIILPWDDRSEGSKTTAFHRSPFASSSNLEWAWRFDVGDDAADSASGFSAELWKVNTPCHPEGDGIAFNALRLGINQHLYYTWFAMTGPAMWWRAHLMGINLETCTVPWRIRRVPARAFKHIGEMDYLGDPILGNLGFVVCYRECHLNPPQVGPNRYISTEGSEPFMGYAGPQTT